VARKSAVAANGAITIADFQNEGRVHNAALPAATPAVWLLPASSPMIRLFTHYPDISIPSVVVVNRQKVQSRCKLFFVVRHAA
jgi:hypothetical protein